MNTDCNESSVPASMLRRSKSSVSCSLLLPHGRRSTQALKKARRQGQSKRQFLLSPNTARAVADILFLLPYHQLLAVGQRSLAVVLQLLLTTTSLQTVNCMLRMIFHPSLLIAFPSALVDLHKLQHLKPAILILLQIDIALHVCLFKASVLGVQAPPVFFLLTFCILVCCLQHEG